MSRWRVGCLAIVAVLVLLPAVPARAATAAVSCVDLDNDGTCGIKEPALGPILDANGGFLDTEFASPGFVPPGGSVGVVLNNFATDNDSLAIYATGDIRINGKLKAKHVESVDLETIQDMFVGAERFDRILGRSMLPERHHPHRSQPRVRRQGPDEGGRRRQFLVRGSEEHRLR